MTRGYVLWIYGMAVSSAERTVSPLRMQWSFRRHRLSLVPIMPPELKLMSGYVCLIRLLGLPV